MSDFEKSSGHEPENKQHTFHESPKPVHHEVRKEVSGKKEEEKSSLMTGLAVLQILLLAFIAFKVGGIDSALTGAVVGGVVDAPTPSPTAAPPSARPPTPTVKIDMKTLIDDDAVKGNKDAPVTIVEFSDFECPFCARFYSQTLGQIEEQYIKTGKVKLVYRDFPLAFHSQAQKSAEAAECAGEQGKYWEMHDTLFEKGVTGGVTSFKQFAKDLGLKTAEFDDCLDSGKMASEVQKDMSDGSQAGIGGTPGFIVNGQLISGAQPFQVFQQAIEAELAK